MTRLSKWRGRLLVLMLLSLGVGCSRPGGTSESREPVSQAAPFQATPEPATASASDPSLVLPQDAPSSAVPFADTQTLPAGTLLNVRLDNGISTGSSGDERSFTAVVEEAVVSEGVTLVPRGATVEGRIESAITSPTTRGRGFLRLALDSIELGGRDVPLQTSSLFARGRTFGTPTVQGVSSGSSSSSSSVVRLEQGRRLTFRLTEPVSITSQVAKSGH